MSITKKSVLLILLILIIDQAVKIYVKLHFSLGEHVDVFGWFKIYFIENNGMAFGMELIGKLFLTLFRIVAVTALAWYIHSLIKKEVRKGYILAVSLVLAGAAGNIIDSLLYGIIFSASNYLGPIASIFQMVAVMPAYFMGKWWTCFIFHSLKMHQAKRCFSAPYSILRIQLSAWQ